MKKYLVLMMLSAVLIAGCDKKTETTASTPAQSVAKVENKALISREQPQNAAPLGLEIGYANLDGVKAHLGSVTRLQDQGTNEYSGGAVLVSDGAGTGVEGLSNLLLIFDKQNILVGVVMTVPKNPKEVLGQLASKYKTVDNRIDTFMNKGYARLQKGDSLIEIDAPHLSFQMEIRYLTKKLMADYLQRSKDNEKQKKQEQTNKL